MACGSRPGLVTVRRRELAGAAAGLAWAAATARLNRDDATAASPAGLACLRLSSAR